MTPIVHDVPPFMIVEGHPARPRHVNRVGLMRNGFSRDQIRCLERACRRLYPARRDHPDATGSMAEKLTDLESQFPDDEHIDYLVAFLRRATAGPHGRYRESFR